MIRDDAEGVDRGALQDVLDLLEANAAECHAAARQADALQGEAPSEAHAESAARCARRAEYLDAARAWLGRVGADALIGQAALLAAPRPAEPDRRGPIVIRHIRAHRGRARRHT